LKTIWGRERNKQLVFPISLSWNSGYLTSGTSQICDMIKGLVITAKKRSIALICSGYRVPQPALSNFRRKFLNIQGRVACSRDFV